MGRITVERPTEGGAAFVVTCPLRRRGGGRDMPEPQVLAPPATKRSILLVDGRSGGAPNGEGPVRTRRAHGGGGTQSAARARLARARLHLILVDAQARTHDHLFVEQLVESHPGLKDRVLVATGDLPAAAEEVLARLSLRYVRKPFNLRDLRDEARGSGPRARCRSLRRPSERREIHRSAGANFTPSRNSSARCNTLLWSAPTARCGPPR